MASRRVHVVSKHAKEVNQNHFPPPPKYISRVPTLVVGKLKVSTFNKGRYSIGRHTILGRGGGGLRYLCTPPIGPFEDSTNGSRGMMSPMSFMVHIGLTNGPNERLKS